MVIIRTLVVMVEVVAVKAVVVMVISIEETREVNSSTYITWPRRWEGSN